MSDAANIVAVFAPQLRDLAVEEFHVGVLDTQWRLEREIRVTTGILDLVAIHPREVFRLVVGAPAAAIILVHNHSGGDPTPSPEDRKLTERFAAAGHMLDNRLAITASLAATAMSVFVRKGGYSYGADCPFRTNR